MNGLNVFSGKRGNPGGISDMRHSLLLNVTWGKRWSGDMKENMVLYNENDTM